MPRSAGANAKAIFRILFTDTETGHNWYEGPYTTRTAARALRTRRVKETNQKLVADGKKPSLKGDVEVGKIVRWEAEDPDAR